VNSTSPSHLPKGRSKRAAVLVGAVEKATEALLIRGSEIAHEHPAHRPELEQVLEDTRQAGADMSHASREFADLPCSSQKRAAMVRAARALLCAVTRLLVLADVVDASALLTALQSVQTDLGRIQQAASDDELKQCFRLLGPNAVLLNAHAARRQAELKDARLKDDLAAARAVLKKNTMMLMTASRVYVRFPELQAARSNRDFVYKQVCEAVSTIEDVAHGRQQSFGEQSLSGLNGEYDGPGELAAALDAFDVSIVMDPGAYREISVRPALEERLESIISGAALMADSSCTRDERRERIVAECNAVRQALQDLLSAYLNNAGTAQPNETLAGSVTEMRRKTRDLRKQLRKAVIDHVSDTYLDTNVPLLVLIEAARAGHEAQVEQCGQVFSMHAAKLVEVAHLACSMSANEEGVKLVRFAAVQISNLCPQVINAARILAARSNSGVAIENMDAFKQAWELQVRLLTEAVDDITTVDDFLAVSESHILEDVNKCVLALQQGDADTLDRTANAIRGRAARVCNVVQAEMDNYEPGLYTEKVMDAVAQLKAQIMVNFTQKVMFAVDSLTKENGNSPSVDENEFVDASRLVYDGVREIRRAVLLNRSVEELDSDAEIEYDDSVYETRSKSSMHNEFDEYPEISGISNARDAYLMVPEEEKQKISAQVETFRIEKNKFDLEVEKWDDTGNDIIVLAKSMCMIMMEMTDFTRGKGPLKTTMDVINAAKKISEYGEKLDKLAQKILDQCQESDTKKDLSAYLKRIALHCHQLNITSKVKADVQNISGNLIVSGLDSATSLIQAAKNLMNAVVLTVKASYVASTKYPRAATAVGSPIVVWKMKAPEKKPLVRREKPEEARAKVRKGSTKKHIAPIKVLSEFETTDSM
jgi:catenin alpha